MKTPVSLLFLFIAAVAFAATPLKPPVVKPELPKQGINVARTGGGWLNVVVDGHRFVVRFFSADLNLLPPDADGGMVRFNYAFARRSANWHVALNPGDDGLSLASPEKVLPPHVFNVFLSLYHEGGAPETYAFCYQ